MRRSVPQPHGESNPEVAERLVVGPLRSFKIMAAPAGSRPTSGGNKRPDDVANQNAGKKNARQIESWWNHLHLMRPCAVMDKLTNGLRAPIFPAKGNFFLIKSVMGRPRGLDNSQAGRASSAIGGRRRLIVGSAGK